MKKTPASHEGYEERRDIRKKDRYSFFIQLIKSIFPEKRLHKKFPVTKWVRRSTLINVESVLSERIRFRLSAFCGRTGIRSGFNSLDMDENIQRHEDQEVIDQVLHGNVNAFERLLVRYGE